VAGTPDAAAAAGGPEARLLEGDLSQHLAVGLTAEETAAATGSTSGAVRVTQHRALDQLRRHLRARDAADAAGTAGRGRPVSGRHARRRTAA
jgi:RNA polymerase sigma-70 factor (ECF subfamily)